MALSKKMKTIKDKVDRTKLYTVEEAVPF